MGWESRKGTSKTYFTRSKRDDGRIVREYFGNGPLGQKAAKEWEESRQLRQEERDRDAANMLVWQAAECATEEYCHFVELVLQATMAENGYHYHRGEWRKRRVPKGTPADDNQTNCEPERPRVVPPRRRPMPERRMLDCRLGLVRTITIAKGVGCFFRPRPVGSICDSSCEKSTRPRTLPMWRNAWPRVGHRARSPPARRAGKRIDSRPMCVPLPGE